MKAVVPAAGRGTRLRPLTDDRPKGLVEVDDRPLLEHVFDELVGLDVTQLLVVTGYRGDQIVERFGASYRDVPLTYIEQAEPLGLADSVAQAEPHVDDDFLVMLGDNVFRGDLDGLPRQHLDGDADATLLVDRVPLDEASRYGVCHLDDDGEVVELVEKPATPRSNVVMTGFYAFSPAIFPACRLVEPSDRGEYELPDAIELLVQAGRTVETVPLEGWRVDVGSPEDRDRAERRLGTEHHASP